MGLPLGHVGELGLDQVRQCQVFKEELHELFLGEREGEVVLALAAVAGLRAAALAALGTLDAIATHMVGVARVHHVAHAALAVVEDGFADVLAGNSDVFRTLDIADVAL